MKHYTMMKFNYEVVINKPSAIVFDFFVTNFSVNFPKINTLALSVKQFPDGYVEEGTVFEVLKADELQTDYILYRENKKLMVELGNPQPDLEGPKETLTYKVIKYIDNETFILQESTYVNVETLSFFFVSQNNNTIVQYEYKMEAPHWWSKIIAIIAKHNYNKYNKPFLYNLRNLLEQS